MATVRKMGDVKLYITYGGNWVGNIYHGGNTNMVFVEKKLTVDELLVKVHEIVGCDPNRFVYELRYLLNIDGKVVRLNIKTDRDLHYVLIEANVNPPNIYVSV